VSTQQADVAVIGGGIVGLAHAWEAARRGLAVVLFERDVRAQSASIRNFGMIWPIGQAAGIVRDRALRSRERWLELAARAGVWHDPCGSLYLAYHHDELAVLEEFAQRAATLGYDCRLLTSAETTARSHAAKSDGLLGALWSPTEICVDPRQAIPAIAAWLAEAFKVQLHFGTPICSVAMPHVTTSHGECWRVERAVICGGVDFQTLFPEVFVNSGIRRCKLQMMRTAPQPDGWRIGPMIAAGLTLLHYPNFQICSTLAAVRERVAAEMPAMVRYGIHVMASQNRSGEVVIGDSHEYDDAIEPFDKSAIDDLILNYLHGIVHLRDFQIAARWHGIYAKHPTLPVFTAKPQPGAFVVAAPGGTGMTVSFGTAEDLWKEWDGSA
jgi:FAD dependent oxidoreductase TIGR03364